MPDPATLVAVVREAKDAHVWEPYACECSCGVVPPVVGGFHQVDEHEDQAIVDAVLSALGTRGTPPIV